MTFLTIDQEQNLQTNQIRVAEVVRGHGGPPPKSSDLDENFKPEQTLFCRELRFYAMSILTPDERLPSSATLNDSWHIKPFEVDFVHKRYMLEDKAATLKAN